MGAIRAVAICVVRDGDRLLGFDVPDYVKDTLGFRPLGGGIEFGETSREAIEREMREELGVELTDVRLLGVLENVFAYLGRPGHEIIFCYEARLTDLAIYETEGIQVMDASDEEEVAHWRPLDDFRSGRVLLYPDGLLDLLGVARRAT